MKAVCSFYQIGRSIAVKIAVTNFVILLIGDKIPNAAPKLHNMMYIGKKIMKNIINKIKILICKQPVIVILIHHTVFDEIKKIFLVKLYVTREKSVCNRSSADGGNGQQNVIELVGFLFSVKIEKCRSDLSAVADAIKINLFRTRVFEHTVNIFVKVSGALFNIHSEIGAEIKNIIVPILADIAAVHTHDFLLIHILAVLICKQICVA